MHSFYKLKFKIKNAFNKPKSIYPFIIVFTTISIAVLWFFFVYNPIKKDVAMYKSKLKSLQKLKKDVPEEHLANLNKKISHLKNEIEQSVRNKFNQSDLLEIISKNNIILNDCKEEKSNKNSKDKLSKIYHVNIEGNFYQIFKFFKKLYSISSIFFDSLKMNLNEDESLNCNFTIKIFKIRKKL